MINLKNLKSKLTRMARIVSSGSIADCDNLRITPKGFSVTNLETTMYVESDTQFESEESVDFRMFQKIVKTGKQSIELKVGPKHDLKIVLDGKKEFTMPFVSDPYLEVLNEDVYKLYNTIEAETLLDIFKYCSDDDLRPSMMGVLLGNTHIVATNGHILKFVENTGVNKLPEVIIPNLKKFVNPKATYKIEIGSKHVKLTNNGEQIVSRIVDGKYVDYNAVIPTQFNSALRINREELIDSIKSALIVTNQTTYEVRFEFVEQELFIRSVDLDFESSFEQKIEKAVDGDFISFSLNGNFLLEICANKREFVDFKIVSPNKALILNGDSLIMPVMKTGK